MCSFFACLFVNHCLLFHKCHNVIFISTGASSSMMEDMKKVVECILTELHHGNFHPVIPFPDLPTPEKELTSIPTKNTQREIAAKLQQNDMTIPTASKSTPPLGPSPAQRKQVLELSHISIVGTPLINRLCSDNSDDDLSNFSPRYSCQEKVMTSSGEPTHSHSLVWGLCGSSCLSRLQ